MIPDLSFPTKFSGAAQLHLFTRYGDPEADCFAAKWITSWDVRTAYPWFPKRPIMVHKHFRPLLDAAFRGLEMQGLHTEIKTFDGAFEVRPIKGSDAVLSTHSWGCAIDLNAALNPIGCEGRWTQAFMEIMCNNQIFCGQHWTGRKDPMHFAMVNG